MKRSRSRSSSSETSRDSLHRRDRRRNSSVSSEDERKNRRSRVQPPPKSKCLGVFGLSASTTEDKIYEIFSKYGKIKRINVIFDTKTGRSRGFCFIYFKHLRDAKDAKESCSGMEIDYRRIRVDYSITSRPHEPTPGVYKGRSTRADPPHRSSRRRSPCSPESYRR
ncbi:transformer-2 sex-determining protein-like isoform X2 [Contarinia nasturtii]|nr:transformer-2 sex-determining protein-like isoform X2 [Contarinia nasturtii]XP_031634889.1 transformer-2 sex-determining protein-like isoform X2 [Contarinia nasturtii]XP_031634891.1 transformer-2 sex-determining protein-like isoform X2 [Contarinia nasturtii]